MSDSPAESPQPADRAEIAAIPRPPRRRRRWWVRIGFYAAVAYGVWCAALYFSQDDLIFPRSLAPRPVATLPAFVQQMSITTDSGRTVPGWFVLVKDASSNRPGPAVLFFHGNAEIIDYLDRPKLLWRRLGLPVLLAEYRGYGQAAGAGEPSQQALVSDGVRFLDALAARPDVDPSRIILHGYSLGGGVAAQVAAQRPVAALILESTFTSVAAFSWSYGVPEFLARHPFRTDEVLSQLTVPVFIGHGRADCIVPVAHGRRLHALVPTSTYLECDCGHLDMPGDRPDDPYREELRRFLVRNGILSER